MERSAAATGRDGNVPTAARAAAVASGARTTEGGFNWRSIALLAGGCLLLVALGVLSTVVAFFPGPQELQWVAVSLAGVALVTFVAFWTDSADIRTAIAAAFVLTYFASLFIFLFYDKAANAVSDGTRKDLFDGFQDLVLLVVTYYFGTKALEQGIAVVTGKGNGGEPTVSPTPPPAGARTEPVDPATETEAGSSPRGAQQSDAT